METKERSSGIELLRLLAMFSIVFYHSIATYLDKCPYDNMVRACVYVNHWGVPVFLLISGFFSIKLRLNRIVSFYFYCTIWMFIDLLIAYITESSDISHQQLFNCLLPFSHTNLWFVQYYFWLMLFSPILNLAVKNMSRRNLISIIIILLIVTLYFSLIWRSPIIVVGKSIIYVSIIYLLGGCVKRELNIFSEYYSVCKKAIIAIVLLVMFITLFLSTRYQFLLGKLVFYYVSPLNIFISVLLLVCFAKIPFKNILINYIAKSAFAVYLFHECYLTKDLFYGIVDKITELSNQSSLIFISYSFLFALVTMVMAIILDIIVRKPIHTFLMKLIEKMPYSSYIIK